MAFGHDKRLAALVIGLPAFALANGGLLTCLLSNGMGLAMLLMYLMPLATHEKAGHSPVLIHSAGMRSRSMES